MRFGRPVAAALVMGACLACMLAAQGPTPGPAASSAPAPWTHRNFNNDPGTFRFAIVADRTGQERPGVFDSAMEKLNALQPEFVLFIGDLIEGRTRDEAQIDRQWDQADRAVNSLSMPFFRIPGNHDIDNPVLTARWKQRYGPTYYHFVYRDVLFLCLNSDDGGVNLVSDEQAEFVRKTLAENASVRWTLVFIHKPLWNARKSVPGWEQVEGLLKDRPYTVFAGHEHKYRQAERNGRKYFILATTGGLSKPGALAEGQFDHVMWVTMKPEGPVMANLLLEGVYGEQVRPPAAQSATSAPAGAGAVKAKGTLPTVGLGR